MASSGAKGSLEGAGRHPGKPVGSCPGYSLRLRATLPGTTDSAPQGPPSFAWASSPAECWTPARCSVTHVGVQGRAAA